MSRNDAMFLVMQKENLKLVGRPRSIDVEHKIMDSASALVAELGYISTSIEKIAAKAGVGKSSIYRRWESKIDLMITVYQNLVPEKALSSKSQSFEKNLRYLLKKLFDLYRNTAAGLILVGLIAQSQSDSEAMLLLKQKFIKDRRTILVSILKRGVTNKEINKSANISEACDLIIAMIWHRLLTDRNKLNSAFINTIVKTVTLVGK